ncbi:MAG TPA: GTP pyrophosphokinase [Verrucomicrobiae bacterium]|nr:GTP pyrophosphokinase [Verrucomicrobiae bacterium]
MKEKTKTADLLERAIEVAVQAHHGQRDKSGGPYILHPLRLMNAVRRPEEKMVAILHDVVEDNDEWTLARLRKEGFPVDVLEAIDHLTRRKDETNDEFVNRAVSHPLARKIKIRDLEDNLNPLRHRELDDKAIAKLMKHHRSWHRVTQREFY